MRLALSCALFLACTASTFVGCAGPFTELPGKSASGSIIATICGNSAHRASSVIAAMDGPPLGETDAPKLEPPKEVTVCVQIENHGTAPAKVDRGRFLLKMSYGLENMIDDADDARFLVPAGELRKTRITFHYGKVMSGEDVKLQMEDVVSVNDKPVRMPVLTMRKK